MQWVRLPSDSNRYSSIWQFFGSAMAQTVRMSATIMVVVTFSAGELELHTKTQATSQELHGTAEATEKFARQASGTRISPLPSTAVSPAKRRNGARRGLAASVSSAAARSLAKT